MRHVSFVASIVLTALTISLVAVSSTRAGLVDISPAASMSADATAAISSGGTTLDRQQAHDAGSLAKPSARVEAIAQDPISRAVANAASTASLLASRDGFSLSASASGTVPPAGSLGGVATSSADGDIPFTIGAGVHGRVQFSLDIAGLVPASESITLLLDRTDEAETVFSHTFHSSYSPHFIDRLEPGTYDLRFAIQSQVNSSAAASRQTSAASLSLAVSPSTVPGIVPLPPALLPGGILLISLGAAGMVRRARASGLVW